MRLMNASGHDRLETIAVAAKRHGIYPPRLRRAVRSGALGGYRVGNWLRVRRSEVDQWVAGHRIGAPCETEKLRRALTRCRECAEATVSESASARQALSNIIDVATAALDGQRGWGEQS